VASSAEKGIVGTEDVGVGKSRVGSGVGGSGGRSAPLGQRRARRTRQRRSGLLSWNASAIGQLRLLP